MTVTILLPFYIQVCIHITMPIHNIIYDKIKLGKLTDLKWLMRAGHTGMVETGLMGLTLERGHWWECPMKQKARRDSKDKN